MWSRGCYRLFVFWMLPIRDVVSLVPFQRHGGPAGCMCGGWIDYRCGRRDALMCTPSREEPFLCHTLTFDGASDAVEKVCRASHPARRTHTYIPSSAAREIVGSQKYRKRREISVISAMINPIISTRTRNCDRGWRRTRKQQWAGAGSLPPLDVDGSQREGHDALEPAQWPEADGWATTQLHPHSPALARSADRRPCMDIAYS